MRKKVYKRIYRLRQALEVFWKELPQTGARCTLALPHQKAVCRLSLGLCIVAFKCEAAQSSLLTIHSPHSCFPFLTVAAFTHQMPGISRMNDSHEKMFFQTADWTPGYNATRRESVPLNLGGIEVSCEQTHHPAY